jgi:anaerobic selenocysteine-containing dehydrogenase
MPPDVAVELRSVELEMPEPGYPLRLVSRRVLHALNGAYLGSKEARRRYPVNYAYMNPDDMAEAGLGDGAMIEIASPHGAIRTLTKAEDRLRRGVVSMTHMFGTLVGNGDPIAERGANVGELTSLTETIEAVNFMPRFSGIPIRVRAVEEPAAAA